MTQVREVSRCRACASVMSEPVIDLGNQYVVDFVPYEREGCLRAPLVLSLCPNCHLLQLRHSVEPDRLYKKFWYRSGINEQMRKALQSVVNMAMAAGELRPDDSVLDIGSNDGTMLSLYPEDIVTVGIDPCADLVKEALENHRQDVGIGDFFCAPAVSYYGPFKAITAVAMFYDLEDPLRFLLDCESVLATDGVIILQLNYLKSMLENYAFDNICHEHLTYFGMRSLSVVVEMAGLEIVGVQTNSINGGSFRVILKRKGENLPESISPEMRMSLYASMHTLMRQEAQLGVDTPELYKSWDAKVKLSCEVLNTKIAQLYAEGKQIYSYGASTRGTTLMQCLQLPVHWLHGAAERDEKKWGLYQAGSWLKIYPEDVCRSKADVFLVQPWHFWEGIKLRERQWLENGGTFVVPLSHPRMVTASGVTSLLTGESMHENAEAKA